MTNYLHTTTPGTSRRRARQIVIDNPAQGEPKVTFVMEDRVIMADGNDTFTDAGMMTVVINNEILQKLYPNYDVETGDINQDKGNRYGDTIVGIIMDALEDVFISEGIARDTPPIIDGNVIDDEQLN